VQHPTHAFDDIEEETIHVLLRRYAPGRPWTGRCPCDLCRGRGLVGQMGTTQHKQLYLKLIILFGCSYQHGLSIVIQCFSLTTKQPQSAYKPQKLSAEQCE
jgi:hypothetical protein